MAAKKKATPKKAANKKTASKKASRKKPPAKKTAAKKTTATKTTARRTSPKESHAAYGFGPAGTAGKADGDAPVRAYLSRLPVPQRALGERVDTIIAREVPDVTRGIKWSMPFYGREGIGWFCAFAAFKAHCAVRFFAGADLEPEPPEGESKGMRGVKYRELADLDEKQLADWVRQASSLPGWGRV